MHYGGKMGLLDGLEKLINEHGSAVILKERIALANDKYAALEQKLSACEAIKKELHSENETLRLNLEQATVEIQNLQKLSEKSHSERLEEVKEKILVFVAHNEDSVDQRIAQAVGVGVAVASFHLEELRKTKMVSNSHITGSDWSGSAARTEWAIAHAGRGYLITHGLIA
jgi:predicted transcriptional regulator